MTPDELTSHIEKNCPKLREYLASFGTEPFLSELYASCSPRNAAGRVNDLMAQAEPAVQVILNCPEDRKILIKTVAGSRFLYSVLARYPELLDEMFTRKGYLTRKGRAAKESDLEILTKDLVRIADFDNTIREYKQKDYLRVGIRDLSDLADVREVMAELSDLAGAGVKAAIDFHWNRLTAKHGRPTSASQGSGFVAVGMGKLSGRELNFSSDVDLIFIREPEEGYTSGPERVNITKFYESLAQSVSKSLSQVTEDGFVFRIDLRLRPEGEQGELVPSMNNALDYYMGWGRTWERAALMKAVSLAGDKPLGERFLKDLEPFIYRKYLDYSTLDEMRVMKLQIEAQLRRKPGINIKLGQGGIREIEFFVQALQLINAGRTLRVRSASTLEGLNLLRETGLVEKEVADRLREAYLFFRKTEHRIQINHQLQTHELPRTAEEQEELALRMGYGDNALENFLADLEHHRKIVEELFSGMFYQTGDGAPDRISPLIKAIVDSIENEPVVEKLLTEAGFEEPAQSCGILKGLLIPSEKKLLTEKAKELLVRLTPLFLEELVKQPEPSKALLAMDAYIESLHAHSTYFSTLLENPPTIGFIARILGESRFFTDLVIRHPQSLDSLIGKGSDEPIKTPESLESSLEERLVYCEDLEDELDVLRRFKNEEMLVIGVHHLEGEIDSPTSRRMVTDLAEVCLDGAVEIALKEMRRKFGYHDFFDALPFVILGMGKFGGREMSYLSDLDVIFIYDPPADYIGKYSAHEWFSRFASRIISILSIPTGEGIAWAIDTRLRPSGNKGPLVSSIESFRDYHAASAQLWERQALIKARPITGLKLLTDQLDDIIRDRIAGAGLTDEEASEIARLRTRMETELAMEDTKHVDLKTGHGGLVDVEFFVQANILKYAKTNPEVLRRNTLQALSALRNEALIDERQFSILDSGYRFLTNLEDRLRIMEHKSIDRMPLEGEKLVSLARRLNYEEGNAGKLVEDYLITTKSIRDVYNSFFEIHS